MQVEIIKSIQTIISPFGDIFFQIVTMTGEEYFYIIAAAIIFWCINKKFGCMGINDNYCACINWYDMV